MEQEHFFSAYHRQLSEHTLKRHRADITSLANYLQTLEWEVSPDDLMYQPAHWCNLTGSIIEQFSDWLLQRGYAIGTISTCLSTIKKYCRVVSEAGLPTHEEFALIYNVEGHYNGRGGYADQSRGIQRLGYKKAKSLFLTHEQARLLKIQPGTPQGLRDAFLMCLLLDHGLRVSEVEGLTVQSLDLEAGTLTFQRERMGRVEQHHLTPDTKRAAAAYIERNHPTTVLLMGSGYIIKGELYGGIGARSIGQRVSKLGKRIGIEGLAPSDCRIYWLGLSASDNLPLPELKERDTSVLTSRYAPHYKEQKLLSLWEA